MCSQAIPDTRRESSGSRSSGPFEGGSKTDNTLLAGTPRQKLISLLSKEIDTLARAAIKAELNSLGAAEYGLDA
jgi:hypothetical protein